MLRYILPIAAAITVLPQATACVSDESVFLDPEIKTEKVSQTVFSSNTNYFQDHFLEVGREREYAKIEDLEGMTEALSAVPANYLTLVKLRWGSAGVFLHNPTELIEAIGRTLQRGGKLKFLHKQMGKNIAAIKSELLQGTRDSNPYEGMSRKIFVESLKDFNPLYQYFEAREVGDYLDFGKPLPETSFFGSYKAQLKVFFRSHGFEDPTYEALDGGTWTVTKL